MTKPDMSDQLATPAKEGWSRPTLSRKFHWFGPDHRSLCGGWMTFARDLDPAMNNSPDDCHTCRRKLEAMT